MTYWQGAWGFDRITERPLCAVSSVARELPMGDQNKKKSESKPPPKPTGLISQTKNRPGGTVTGSYKTINEERSDKK